MNYIVGYPIKENKSFLNTIIQNKNSISEVYFSWGDIPNGRSALSIDDALTPFEMQQRQANNLKLLSSEGIRLNMLFNANCYGKDSQSREFFNRIGNLIDYISREFGLSSVTTSSILIAKFIKANFEDIDVRASVNMDIGSVEGLSYVSSFFDSFYAKRELNRNLPALMRLRKWCDNNDKEMYLLANSGCLNNCSAHTSCSITAPRLCLLHTLVEKTIGAIENKNKNSICLRPNIIPAKNKLYKARGYRSL